MKWLVIIVIAVGFSGCSLLPELDNLGSDLGIRVKDQYEAFTFAYDRLSYQFHSSKSMPSKILRQGTGDCVEYSLLVLKVCHDSGIDGELITTANPNVVGHCWVRFAGNDYEPQDPKGKINIDLPLYHAAPQKVIPYHEIVNHSMELHIDLLAN